MNFTHKKKHPLSIYVWTSDDQEEKNYYYFLKAASFSIRAENLGNSTENDRKSN